MDNLNEQSNFSTDLVISNDNLFVKNLNLLKQITDQLPKEINLPTVPADGGLFGLFDHNVTGNELNNLTEKIQNKFIEQNKIILKTVQEFKTVYDTISALDKVYVQEILKTLNIALKTIEDVKAANERINAQQNDIIDAQQDIKQIINQQKQIIQVLQKESTDIRNMNTTLSKSLLLTKGLSIAGLALSFTLITLFLTGVL